mmetsp:Transcript_2990/g.6222  ORF Transcript_2990/g.6222 Transcript_2990/m.6222 type:complete len:376 (-) Transcript_2990:27-1154(-)
MILKVNLLWGVALISAGVSSKTAVAFVQNCWNFRHGEMTAVTLSFGRSFLTPLLSSNANQAEDADPDLFDYFDPLLSPHAYPSGISPEKKTQYQSNEEVQEEQQRSPQNFKDSASKGQFGFRLSTDEQTDEENQSPPSSTKGEFGFKIRSNAPTDRPTMEQEDGAQDADLFDYFDPLRSPHEYPDGIKSNKELESSVATPSALEVVDDSLGSNSRTNAISNGKKKKVGVLLMDHGSRKEKSNARLQKMAELYQMTLGTDEDEEDENAPTIIVRAAHMEIATPSIPDGLKDLKDQGVDEIICHPFFLSADGRHVKEDIPEIIGEAIDDLWGEATGATPIPIVTTAPVGSNTQLMLGAIHSLVRENSEFIKTTLQNE